MTEIRLIDANDLEIELTMQKAHLMDKSKHTTIESDRMMYMNTATGLIHAINILHNAPTVEFHYKPKRMKINKDGSAEFKYAPQGEWIETNSNDENIICPFCKTEFNGDIKLICGGENPKFCPDCGSDMRPEKKLQTPSCLTNPERQAELLERYKEE